MEAAARAATQAREGVIRFVADHEQRPLEPRRYEELHAVLESWRALLLQMGVLGQEAGRYGGAGYGNVSGRVGLQAAPRGQRPFLVTGTQTGNLARLGLRDYALVSRYWFEDNRVSSQGETLPSSESMTHGALYDLTPAIRYVFHGHCPPIWRAARILRLPTSDPAVEYGTPEMAAEVHRLWEDTTLANERVLAMGGHEDGVITFGYTPEEAGLALVSAWVRAKRIMPSA